MEFEWDRRKAAANLRKHGVSFESACGAFGDEHSLCVEDPDHSQGERRFLLFGRTVSGQSLVVPYTERDGRFRLISARG